MSVREKDDPDLFTRIQEHNLLRQYDLLTNSIEIGLKKGIEAFDKYTLWALNYAATSNISQFGGRYREEPIYVGNHRPPHFKVVPNPMDRFFSVIHENWDIIESPTVLPAYALWRLNWIHPFVEGNGRTARAACYYLLCVKQGQLLPGSKIVPERIRDNRKPYYAALRSADVAWENGDFDVSDLARYLEGLLIDQLSDPIDVEVNPATNGTADLSEQPEQAPPDHT
jgi:fido (protein-threonine AMPylation protein)